MYDHDFWVIIIANSLKVWTFSMTPTETNDTTLSPRTHQSCGSTSPDKPFSIWLRVWPVNYKSDCPPGMIGTMECNICVSQDAWEILIWFWLPCPVMCYVEEYKYKKFLKGRVWGCVWNTHLPALENLCDGGPWFVTVMTDEECIRDKISVMSTCQLHVEG